MTSSSSAQWHRLQGSETAATTWKNGRVVAAVLELDLPSGVRNVRLLEPRDFLFAEHQRLGRERILDLLDLRGSDDRRRDARFV